MSDLYGDDIVTWSRRQAELLRQVSTGEHVNETPDWANIIEEIEAVGASAVNATLSQIDNILRHRLYLLGWPEALTVRRWTVELEEFGEQLHRLYRRREGDVQVTDVYVQTAYARARRWCLAHMDTGPSQPLPQACPWTLNDVLSEAL